MSEIGIIEPVRRVALKLPDKSGIKDFATPDGYKLRQIDELKGLGKSRFCVNIGSAIYRSGGYNFASDNWLAKKSLGGTRIIAIDPVIDEAINSPRGHLGKVDWLKGKSGIEVDLVPALSSNPDLKKILDGKAEVVLVQSPSPEAFETVVTDGYSFVKPKSEGILVVILDPMNTDKVYDVIGLCPDYKEIRINGEIYKRGKPFKPMTVADYYSAGYPQSSVIPMDQSNKHVNVVEITKK